MKRKTIVWTLTSLGLLAGAAFAINRYTALAQGPNQSYNRFLPPVTSQPTSTPYANTYGAPPVATPFGWLNSNAPNVINTFGMPAANASPASHQDEMRVQQLLKEYQSSKEEAKRKELVEQISKSVAHQFEEKQLIRERELKELEERVKELRITHTKRESLKEKIIADRVQQLINNVDGMGWGYEPNNLMIPNSGSPLLSPTIQYAPPGYVPVQTTTSNGLPMIPGQPTLPGQTAARAPRAYSSGMGGQAALPSSMPTPTTAAAPAAVIPPTEAVAPSAPIEPAEALQPEITPVAPAVDDIKEPGR